MKKILLLAILTIMTIFYSQALSAQDSDQKDVKLKEKIVERLDSAAKVFQEIMDTPDNTIPSNLYNRCNCIAIIPGMKKAGFIFGGRYGRGVVSCKIGSSSGHWGPPSMITLGGGSFGLQIGGASTDIIMLIMAKDGVKSLLKDKFTLGGDASVAGGPVGRAGTAETDAFMQAKILSYSRSRGAFAGLELKGAVVTQDKEANQSIYGREVDAKDLLVDPKFHSPQAAQRLLQVLSKYSAIVKTQ